MTWLHRALLRLWPRGRRDRYGADISRVFAEQRASASVAGRVSLWAKEIAAILVVAIRERWPRRRGSGRSAATRLDRWGGNMRKWIVDFRHARLALSRRPGAAASIVVVLTLGIGLSTAMFALADPYLLRPLPYAAPAELVAIEVGAGGLTRDASLPSIEDWRARHDVFTGIAVANSGGSIERLRLSDGIVTLISQSVSANFFEVLGVPGPLADQWGATAERSLAFLPASRGRVPDDALEGGTLIDAVGGGPVRSAGTLRQSFVLPFVPPLEVLALTPAVSERIITVRAWNDDGTVQRFAASPLVARLASGVTPAAAREALAQALPSGRRLDVSVTPLHDRMTDRLESLALGALAAGVLVLLVCAGNVAHLWLANSIRRANEMATRRALGASRLDVLRLSCLEVGLLVGLGTGLAFALAAAALIVQGQVLPSEYRALGAPAFTGRVAAFGLCAAVLVSVLGILPVLFRTVGASHGAPRFGATGRRLGWSMRASFVAVQTTLATILAIGATFLAHSYANLEGQRIGFDRGVIAVTAVYPTGTAAPAAEVYDQSAERLSRLPGVTGVAIFFGNVVIGELAEVVGRLTPPWLAEMDLDGRRVEVTTRTVSPGFFGVTGLAVVEGRALQPDDLAGRGVVVNQRLASLLGAEGPLVGRVLRVNDQQVTIVGVVEDAIERRFTDHPMPTLYDAFGTRRAGAVTYLMRVNDESSAYAVPVRRALGEVEPDVSVIEVNTLGAKLSNTVQDRTFATLVLILFGVAGAGVTVTGLVGIVAFTVDWRTREIAIRLALGARTGHVRWLVISEVVLASLAGTVTGLVAGRWLSTGLESLVYGVEAGNWITSTASAVVMLAVAALAAVVTARRAVRLQPTEALRVE